MPSGQPTSAPSGQPSHQPSSNPTLLSPFLLQAEQGGNSSRPVVWDMSSLGYSNTTLPIYMTVAVMPTSFEFPANQWATITINGRVVVEFCTPQQACGSSWFLCTDQMNVYDQLNSSVGGQLLIEVSVTGVESGPCDYEGFPLYASLVLSETYVPHKKPPAELHVMVIVIPIVVFLFCLLPLAYFLDKVLAYRKANDKYRVRQAVDVELGGDLENRDPDEHDQHLRPPPPPLPQTNAVHRLSRHWTRANSRHLRKVHPVEHDDDVDVEGEGDRGDRARGDREDEECKEHEDGHD